jgi:hypothetical protein
LNGIVDDVSGRAVCPVFKGQLVGGTDSLSRIVCSYLSAPRNMPEERRSQRCDILAAPGMICWCPGVLDAQFLNHGVGTNTFEQ